MIACPAFDPAAAYLPAAAAYADCQAQALGAQGWQALAADGGFGMALSGLVAIAIALIGYRLLLGETLALADAVLAALRIGIAIALATSWATWRPLVYDLATSAPEHIATTLTGGPGTLALVARMQTVLDALAALRAQPGLPGTGAIGGDVPIGANIALGHAAQVLTLSTLGGLIAVKLLAGVLLAVGPLFAAMLLFPATWGLFAGWVRALAGAALGALAVPLVLGIELAMIAPQVDAVTRALSGNAGAGGLPDAILSTALVFALAMAVVLAGMGRVAWGFTLPRPHRHAEPAPPHPAPIAAPATITAAAHTHTRAATASRTETIATSLLRLEVRDRLAATPAPATPAAPAAPAPRATPTLRPSTPRPSRAAQLRDNRA